MSNFSGMIAFQTQNPVPLAQAFAEHLQIVHYAVSLGHQRSLIYYISTQEMLETSFTLNQIQVADYRNFAGDGVFRFSVGLEDVEDICKDLELSMKKA